MKLMKKLGFTVVELIVAMVVLSIILTTGAFSYVGYRQKSKTHQNKLHAEEVIRKMTVWTTVEKKYPSELGDLTDADSLLNTISQDTRERLTHPTSNPGSPSANHPDNIEVLFCYRPTDFSTPIGARAYYWDLRKKIQKYQYYGNSEETGVKCFP